MRSRKRAPLERQEALASLHQIKEYVAFLARLCALTALNCSGGIRVSPSKALRSFSYQGATRSQIAQVMALQALTSGKTQATAKTGHSQCR